MRYLLIAVLLTGCGLDPAYREARDAKQLAKYEQECTKIGYQPGTERMADCKLQMKLAAEGQRGAPVQNTVKTCQAIGNTVQCF